APGDAEGDREVSGVDQDAVYRRQQPPRGRAGPRDPRAERQAARDRRSVQRDQGSARRLLHDRGGGLRRGGDARDEASASRVRRHDPDSGAVPPALTRAAPPAFLRARAGGGGGPRRPRLLGPDHVGLAEETVQEAMLRALQTWPYQGIPDNAASWLYRVAHNIAIDAVRRARTFGEKTDA